MVKAKTRLVNAVVLQAANHMMLDSAVRAHAMGRTYDAVGHTEEAADYCRAVLACFPDNQFARRLLTYYLSVQYRRKTEDNNKLPIMGRKRRKQAGKGHRVEEEKRHAMLKLASDLEASVGQVMNQVSLTATGMQSSSEVISATIQELSSSITEISRQVSQASAIVSTTVTEAEQMSVKVQRLALAAQEIGEVVALVTNIAEQANLLALNAAIEVARAGEAGKGFALVASEAKDLANQTDKAIEDIGARIAGIQASTQQAVSAIEAISRSISKIDEAAANAYEMASRDLPRQSELLRAEINRFLSGVQAA